MPLVADLRTKNQRLWDQAVAHSFPRELLAGTLPLDKFQRYFLQDYVFLRHFVGLLALAVAKAPDFATARRLASFLVGVLEGEEGLFRRAFQAWGWPPERYERPTPLPTARAMGDFMVRVAYDGSFADILTVLVTTESVYLDWASRPAAKTQPQLYREWTLIHSNDEFRQFVQWLEATLDATPLTERDRTRVAELFETTLRYELAFWEMGYKGE